MRHLPDWLRRQRAQQLVNWGRARIVAAASFGDAIETAHPESPFHVVPGVYVAGRPAVFSRALDPPFDIIEESVGYPGQHGMVKRFLREDLQPARARALDSAICLGPQPHIYDSFWHWMHEALVQAVLAEEIGFTGVYIVPPQSYARETLMQIGVAPERIVVHAGQLWKVARLYVAPHVAGGRLLHYPEVLGRVRTAMLRKVTPRKARDRVYISRNRPNVPRQIVNETEFKGLIGKFGFREYFCEDHSIAEQVEFFTGCEAAIGSHGAGFANTLYMPERSLVVPLYPPMRQESGGSLVEARLLRHRFHPVLPYTHAGYAHGDDVVANLDLIEVILEREFS